MSLLTPAILWLGLYSDGLTPIQVTGILQQQYGYNYILQANRGREYHLVHVHFYARPADIVVLDPYAKRQSRVEHIWTSVYQDTYFKAHVGCKVTMTLLFDRRHIDHSSHSYFSDSEPPDCRQGDEYLEARNTLSWGSSSTEITAHKDLFFMLPAYGGPYRVLGVRPANDRLNPVQRPGIIR